MTLVKTIDTTITYFLNQLIPRSVFFDSLFSFFSIQGASIIIWLSIAILVVFFEEKKHPGVSKKDRRFVFLLAVSLVTTFVLVNSALKPIFHRHRPPNSYPLTPNICPTDYSFPSSHAATAFAAAAVLIYFDKKRRLIYWTIAVLISLSRIYLGCHYFFDVVAGAAIGYFIGRLILLVK